MNMRRRLGRSSASLGCPIDYNGKNRELKYKSRKAFVIGFVAFLVIVALFQSRASHADAARNPNIRILSLDGQTDGTQYVVYNANIYTMATEVFQAPQQAMAVLSGRILEVGTDDELLSKYPTFAHFDAEGLTVIPGFIDSHVHLALQGQKMEEVMLHHANTEEECITIIKEYVAEHNMRPGEWIRGAGWDHSKFPGHKLPSKESLDKAFPNNPIFFRDINYHVIWVNTAAMNLATIPDGDLEGGKVERDANGSPTGILREAANNIITSILPEYSREDTRRFYLTAVEACQKYGVTGIHMAGEHKDDIELIKELIAGGEFDLRAYLMLRGDDDEIMDSFCTGNNPQPQVLEHGDGRLTIRAMKVIMDGSLSPKGAAMIENYVGEDHNGLMRKEPQEYTRLIRTWAGCGYQICIHCIGNRCVRDILNAYESEFRAHPDWQRNRWRIEHAEILTAHDLPRFAELGVLPSVQPTHFPHHMRYVPAIVGEGVAKFGLLGKSLLNTGIIMPLGSDFPAVSEVDPLHGLFAAISRQMPDGTPPGGFQPEERLSIWEAVRGYTYHSAYGAHEEHKVGTLETGKRADFLFLSNDLLKGADNDFTLVQRTEVLATIFSGKCVFNHVDISIGGLC